MIGTANRRKERVCSSHPEENSVADINVEPAFISGEEVAGPAALLKIELRRDTRRWPSRLAAALRRTMRQMRKQS
jgi:hypothetical protein